MVNIQIGVRNMISAYAAAAFVSINIQQGQAMPDADAPKYIAKAIVHELELKEIASRFEKRYLKLDKHKELVYIGIIARVMIEQKASYTWKF